MNNLAVLVLAVILVLLICLLFGLMFSYYCLLKRIAGRFPSYYKRLGSPFLPTASWSITKTIRRDRANYSLLGRLLKAVPSDFPKDNQLKRLARSVQLELLLSILMMLLGSIDILVLLLS